MPTDVDVTDPKRAIYVPVPHASNPEACRVCHGAAGLDAQGDHYPTCWNCRPAALPQGATRLVIPISLVHKTESHLYQAMRDYKNERSTDQVKATHSLLLAATLQRFLREHRGCIANAAGDWDTITVVPSTRGRVPHPLEDVIGRAPELRDSCATLLRATGQTVEHQLNADAFDADPSANGRGVLIVDDTFTTGSSLQSAAIALSRAGAHVVGAVVIGNVIDTSNPDYPGQNYWRRQRSQRFDFGTCCLEP